MITLPSAASAALSQPVQHVDLPQNDDAERSVLGAILVESRHVDEVSDLLRADDFYRPAHQRIYRAMLEMAEESAPIDVLTLAERLAGDSAVEAVGGMAYISRLMDGIPKLVNVRHYARIVRERSVRRQLVRTATELVTEAAAGESDIDQMLGTATRRISDIGERQLQQGLVPMKTLLEASLDDIEKRQGADSTITGVPTGFSELDELTSGLQKGELVILAARPSIGKTALAMSIAQNAAVRSDKRVAVFSMEMSAVQLAMRMLCSEARIDAQKMRRGQLNDLHWSKLMKAFTRLAAAPMFIDETSGITVQEIRAKTKRLQAEGALDLIVIDYLQLMGSAERTENRQQEISTISRSLKKLATDLKVPVLALAQLSRAPDQRQGDHRPILSDLRESGCIAGDSLVTMADSGMRVPIRELAGRRDVRVLALNETTCRLEAATVSRAFPTGRKPVFRLRTQLGREIRATANHQFRTLAGWCRLDALAEGQHVALPRLVRAGDSGGLTRAELALLAHLIGDGCTLPRHVIQYTTREADLAETVARLAREAFGDLVHPRIERERTWIQVYLSSTRHHARGTRSAVAEWLTALGVFGLRSHEKRVPEAVFACTPDEVGLFLRHLWATDGCVSLRGDSRGLPTIYYASSSSQLASDVQALLLRVGINARLTVVSQGVKGRDQHHVTVTGKPDQMAFLERVGTVGKRRGGVAASIERVLAARTHNTNRDVIPADVWSMTVLPTMQRSGVTHRELAARMGTAYCGSTLLRQNLSRTRAALVAHAAGDEDLARLAASDIYWDRIASIEPDGEDDVFDLTVPGHHNFLANDIIVHNSLEQDADVVMFIYREEVIRIREGKDPGDKKGVAEIIVAKQRNGPVDTVKLAFIKEWTRFENLQREGPGDAPLPAPPAAGREGSDFDDAAPF